MFLKNILYIFYILRFLFVKSNYIYKFCRITKYVTPMKYFFERIIDPAGKEKTNVYAYMFLCDFFNFLLLIFGFSAFGVSTWGKSFAKLLIFV